ncbi:hypothetical protein SAMN05421678_11536 [Actinopolymorpha cephalotaxi]|uniref:Uncharacterized protein n=1 Tax=Actinopolymorpha cephalotaxi TaxID=504797 RepID=A0A1I2YVG9_9ACTN|nr:hypothetical protein [Actinopolymorpha cephalotaxi]NYH81717.1 hypothetical protein [Actinopolymorpha cephalotaxi]SFH29648.1 hypothetical protein SAMN05421678_11536 [Actinopolymorpha cephalotaxi]
MRELYTYEIASTTPEGRWTPVVIRTGWFSRDPESIARGLMESWILDYRGRLTSGQIYAFGKPERANSARLVASVRVRVFRGGDVDVSTAKPVAIALLGRPDLSRQRDRHPGGTAGGGSPPAEETDPNRRPRVRDRLRLPRARPEEEHPGDRHLHRLVPG